MHWHFFASYPCLLMYEYGYTSTAFHKRNLSKVNIYAHCVLCSQHLCHFETHSFECGWHIQIQNVCHVKKQNKKKVFALMISFLFYLDFWFGWRPPSGQHADQHPQLPPQPPADTEPHHASVWSHGHSTE